MATSTVPLARPAATAAAPSRPLASIPGLPGGAPSISDIAAALCRRDGPYHAGPRRYFADLSDAVTQRRWLAERLLDRAMRGRREAIAEIRALLAPSRSHCAWCGEPLAIETPTVDAGGALLHRVGCSDEFATFVQGGHQ